MAAEVPNAVTVSTEGAQVRMEAIAATIKELPTLPSVVAKVVEVTNDPNASPNDIAKVVLTDPAATAKLLRIANSAYYSFAKRISTITEAIVVLGLYTVRNTLLTVFYQSMHHDLQRQKGTPRIHDFWKHSVCTALVARNLAGSQDLSFREKCYVAGLLHDLGRLVLCMHDLTAALQMTHEAITTGRDLEDVEIQHLGFSHGQLGEYVARQWRLPNEICEAIGQHHAAGSTSDPKLSAIIHAAHYLVSASKVGPEDDVKDELKPSVRDLLGLDNTRIAAIIDGMPDIAKEADTLSGLAR